MPFKILPFAKNAKELGKKLWDATKSIFHKEGYEPVFDLYKGLGVVTPKGIIWVPKQISEESDQFDKTLEWIRANAGNPREWLYEEPDDEFIQKGIVRQDKNPLPEYYEGEVLPAQTKPNIAKLKEWVREVKFLNMSPIDLRMEYNRTKGTTSDAPLTGRQYEALVDSIAYKISRKIYYVGRRSSNETDHQFNERTKHMRPVMGSYSPNETWEGDFPYDETYSYVAGDVEGFVEKLKRGDKVSW